MILHGVGGATEMVHDVTGPPDEIVSFLRPRSEPATLAGPFRNDRTRRVDLSEKCELNDHELIRVQPLKATKKSNADKTTI